LSRVRWTSARSNSLAPIGPWRSSSAARHLFGGTEWVEHLDGDVIHLSGVTLQLASPAAREALGHRLAALRAAGTLISLDTNYRAAGWSSPGEAAHAMDEVARTASSRPGLFADPGGPSRHVESSRSWPMMTNSEDDAARPEWHNADGESASPDSADLPCDEPIRLRGPVVTLRVTVGLLGVLALVLALTAGSFAVALTALGVIGLVPLTLGAVVRGFGWHGGGQERDENAAIVLPVAALCWQPIVLITALGEQILHGGVVAMVAGVAALVLSICCARP
jgi:hypothetical protein